MAKKRERVYDELLCFLSEPMFQIPVKSFMDENCLSMPMQFHYKGLLWVATGKCGIV